MSAMPSPSWYSDVKQETRNLWKAEKSSVEPGEDTVSAGRLGI